MKTYKLIFLIFALVIRISACKEPELVSKQKNYDPVPNNETISILQKTDTIPNDYILVGSVNVDKTNNFSL